MSERLPRNLRRIAASPLCAICRHLKADHITDRDGRPYCTGAACGCYGYVQPVARQHRDDLDDSALPRLRHDWSGGEA